MKSTPWDVVISAIGLFLIMVAAWSWQRTALQHHTPSVATEPWQHVRERVPMPEAFAHPSDISPGLLESVIPLNPFSPARRQLPQGAGGASGEPMATPPPPPQFVYKGRVLMGTTQRAILEELTTKKTYFLQVGQEVTGFKVLDIAENRVLVRNLQTKEEVVVLLTSKVPSTPSAGGPGPEGAVSTKGSSGP